MSKKFTVRFRELNQMTGLSSDSCSRRKRDGSWLQGAHYFGEGAATRYNISLICDWLANRSNPAAHQRAIANFLASLPSNAPAKPGRKPAKK